MQIFKKIFFVFSFLLIAAPLHAAPKYTFAVAKETKLNTGVILSASDLMKIVNSNSNYLNNNLNEDQTVLQKKQSNLLQLSNGYSKSIEAGWNQTTTTPQIIADEIKKSLDQGQPFKSVFPMAMKKYNSDFSFVLKNSTIDASLVSNQLLLIYPPPKQAQRILPITDPDHPGSFFTYLGAGWFFPVTTPLPPPPTGITHSYTDFSIVGRTGAAGMPTASGKFSQSSRSWIAEAFTVTSLFANVFETDSRTRRVRAEFNFTNLTYDMTVVGGLGWADAGSRVRVSVLDGSTLLCRNEHSLNWLGGIIGGNTFRRTVPTLSLNCTFENPVMGLPVVFTVLVETISWSGAGGIMSFGESLLDGDDINVRVDEIF